METNNQGTKMATDREIKGINIANKMLADNPSTAAYLNDIKGSRRKKQLLVDDIAEEIARPILDKTYKNVINEFIINVIKLATRQI